MEKKLISVVVPMYFEEEVALECYKRLKSVFSNIQKYNYEFIFVNDGSADKTLEILEGIAKKDKDVKVISFSRNFGHQIALTAGIDYSMGNAVVLIDADLQDPPELILDMIKLWENGYDVVYAKRKKRKSESWFKLFTAKAFYKILNLATDIKIPVNTGDFRLMDEKVVAAFKCMKEKNRFIRGMVSWTGFKQIPVEYDRDARYAGETKYPLKKMLKFAFDGIVSFSLKPIKLVLHVGVFSVIIAILVFLYSIYVKLTGQPQLLRGWTSIMVAITFFSGVQLISIGVIGEYIARIYDESKDRPLYLIEKKINIASKKEKDYLRTFKVHNIYDKV